MQVFLFARGALFFYKILTTKFNKYLKIRPCSEWYMRLFLWYNNIIDHEITGRLIYSDRNT